MILDRQQSLISRIGEDKLVQFIGASAIGMLADLGSEYKNAGRLAGLLLSIEGEGVLISRPDIRSAVFDSLSETDASRLVSKLNLANSGSPWETLSRANFRKGSSNYMALIDWLNISNWASTARSEPEETKEKRLTIEPQYPLFPHQISAIDRIEEALDQENGRALLHMPTGSGKTRSAINVVTNFFRKNSEKVSVIWLAHVEELCEQAATEFEKAWAALGNRPIDVIRHYGSLTSGTIDNPENSFIVLSLQSAHALRASENRDQSFYSLTRAVSGGLVVIDEAHKATAPTYAHVLDFLAPRRRTKLLGLTATPGRSWLDVDEDL